MGSGTPTPEQFFFWCWPSVGRACYPFTFRAGMYATRWQRSQRGLCNHLRMRQASWKNTARIVSLRPLEFDQWIFILQHGAILMAAGVSRGFSQIMGCWSLPLQTFQGSLPTFTCTFVKSLSAFFQKTVEAVCAHYFHILLQLHPLRGMSDDLGSFPVKITTCGTWVSLDSLK